MTPQRWFGLVGVVVALLLAGGSVLLAMGRDGLPPQEVSQRYLDALVAADARALCTWSTGELRSEVLAGARDCTDLPGAPAPADVAAAAARTGVLINLGQVLVVDRDTATADFTLTVPGDAADVSDQLQLVQVGGEWRIAAGPRGPLALG
ncbi:hypothetical protein [Nocardioides sp.]|uniref:hypothetical protein n=1 Tax=Nocardioides sp. TaxID=35761 RepID=UPI0035161A1D